MKVVILCGGKGTRLAEETHLRPKPMVEIGGKPILTHIMEHYAKHGFEDFVLALGYKGDYIKEYFLNYYQLTSDFQIDMKNGGVNYLKETPKNWKVSLVDTGLETLTGGRLARLEDVIKPSGTFMLTYGDGVSNVDLTEALKFHRSHGKLATVTGVRPPARFGEMKFDEQNQVTEFAEKPQASTGWINGGFFIFEPQVFNFLNNGDATILEREPLEMLCQKNQLMVFKHDQFWQCMDTLRDKEYLNSLWESGDAPWK